MIHLYYGDDTEKLELYVRANAPSGNRTVYDYTEYAPMKLLGLIKDGTLYKDILFVDTVVILFPESALHQKYHADIADWIYKCNMQSNVYVATHSEHILSSLEALIAADELPKEDLNVYCLDGDTAIRCGPEMLITSEFMAVCPICGSKRCPKAGDSSLECANSYDTGQPGGIYQ
ncbi:hypothetical protein [Acinetobacter sp.]|uniref:hypothetical protein n=1 Tax=Acinetobacter sp. TaxID=472 RepID=UPI003D001CBF